MKYYILYKADGNSRLWNQYFTFDAFLYLNDNVVRYNSPPKSKRKKFSLKVLSKETHYNNKPLKFVEFEKTVDNILAIRDDITKLLDITNFNGVSYQKVNVIGAPEVTYKILKFDNILDCLNRDKSVLNNYNPASTLILDPQLIPSNIDGFFLDKAHSYGAYYSVVSEELKNAIEKLPMAKKMLEFEEIKQETPS